MNFPLTLSCRRDLACLARLASKSMHWSDHKFKAMRRIGGTFASFSILLTPRGGEAMYAKVQIEKCMSVFTTVNKEY